MGCILSSTYSQIESFQQSNVTHLSTLHCSYLTLSTWDVPQKWLQQKRSIHLDQYINIFWIDLRVNTYDSDRSQYIRCHPAWPILTSTSMQHHSLNAEDHKTLVAMARFSFLAGITMVGHWVQSVRRSNT